METTIFGKKFEVYLEKKGKDVCLEMKGPRANPPDLTQTIFVLTEDGDLIIPSYIYPFWNLKNISEESRNAGAEEPQETVS